MTVRSFVNKSMSYIATSKLVSRVPVSCHCQVTPGLGIQTAFALGAATVATRVDAAPAGPPPAAAAPLELEAPGIPPPPAALGAVGAGTFTPGGGAFGAAYIGLLRLTVAAGAAGVARLE